MKHRRRLNGTRHIDRTTVRDAATAGQSVAVLFYEDLPQSLKLWEESIAESAKVLQASRQFVSEPTDAASAVARKRRIAWCYNSQIDEAETAAIAERSRGIWRSRAALGYSLLPFPQGICFCYFFVIPSGRVRPFLIPFRQSTRSMRKSYPR